MTVTKGMFICIFVIRLTSSDEDEQQKQPSCYDEIGFEFPEI